MFGDVLAFSKGSKLHISLQVEEKNRDFFRFLHYECKQQCAHKRTTKSVLELSAIQVSELFRIIDQARIPRARRDKIPSLLGDSSTWASGISGLDGSLYKLEVAFCSHTSAFQWWSLGGEGIEDLISIGNKLIEMKKIAKPIPLGKK